MGDGTDGPGHGRTVVVVEDNVRSRRLVRDLLDLNGFTTIDVESGEEGVAAVREHVPDLVLMDIQLPGMDGEAALRALRSDPRTAGVKAVAVTAYAMPGDEDRLLRSGFDAYIAKPIDTRTFVDRLLAIMDGDGA